MDKICLRVRVWAFGDGHSRVNFPTIRAVFVVRPKNLPLRGSLDWILLFSAPVKRTILFIVVVLLLLGGLGCWQHDRITGFMAAYGFGGFGGGGGAGSGGGGGGGGAKAQVAPPTELEGVKVVGIINSTRSSTVINAYGKLYTMMVGDELLLQIGKGEPQKAKCEAINGVTVTLHFPASNGRVELLLSK